MDDVVESKPDKVLSPVKTQDELDLEKYRKQLDMLVKQQTQISEAVSQTRGIVLFLQEKLKK